MNFTKQIVRGALHGLGGLDLVRYRNRNDFRIIMYHRFPGPTSQVQDNLSRQMEAFRRYYELVSLAEIAERLELGRPSPRALAITVDDGYRDFFEVAFPVLEAMRIPATVYLVSDFLDKKTWLWTDRIIFALGATRRTSFEITIGGTNRRFSLSDAGTRYTVAIEIIQAAKRRPNAERIELVERLLTLLEVALPDEPPVDMRPLSWDEVRAMAGTGIEFGSHTRTHPILSRIDERDELRDEIEHSKRRLEQELSAPVLHFCYPNGSPDDYNSATVSCVQELGFRTAVTTVSGFNSAGAKPLLLRRFGMEPGSTVQFALERVEGLHDDTTQPV